MHREDGFGRYDIYISFLGANGWSIAQNIGPSINSPYWESQPSISPDGKELYFVSNRPGGQGKNGSMEKHANTSRKFPRAD